MSTLDTDAVKDWEGRIAAAWKIADTLSPEELVRTIDALAAERPADDATALFERACARDTAGIEDGAEPLYRAALAAGTLDAYRHARASIQLGSTLRILGHRRRCVEQGQKKVRRRFPGTSLLAKRCASWLALARGRVFVRGRIGETGWTGGGLSGSPCR